VVIFREAAWPCAIDFMKFIGTCAAANVQLDDSYSEKLSTMQEIFLIRQDDNSSMCE